MSNSIEDWEKIRVQAAIAAMQGILAANDTEYSLVCQSAVWHADRLIAKLREKEEAK